MDNNSKKPEYRVINIPYELKQKNAGADSFEELSDGNSDRSSSGQGKDQSDRPQSTKHRRNMDKSGGPLYGMIKRSGQKKEKKRAAHEKATEKKERDTAVRETVRRDHNSNNLNGQHPNENPNGQNKSGKTDRKENGKKKTGLTDRLPFKGKAKKSPTEQNKTKDSRSFVSEKGGKKMTVIPGGKLGRLTKFKKSIAAIAVLLVIFITANVTIPIGLLDSTGEFFAGLGASGEGFPLSISSAVGKNISTVGTDIAVLCQSTLMLYKSNGKQIYNRPHGFSNPAVSTSNYRTLVYDRGGKGYKIEKRGGTLIDSTAQNDIITAAICDNGAFALATRSSDYVCDVTAFDKRGNQKMQWHSSDRQVVCLAVSDDGSFLGVGTLESKNGKAVSAILLFRTGDGTLICDNSYENHTVVSLDFKGDCLVGIFDGMLCSVNTKGVKNDYDLQSAKVSCFAQSSSAAAVTVEKYNDSANNQLMLFDKNLNLLYTTDIGAEAVSLSLSGNKAVVLSGEKVISFDSRGQQQKSLDAGTDARQIVSSSAGTAVLGTLRIEWRKV